MKQNAIEGVVIKELVTHADERGFFREVIRETDEFFEHFGQWSHSLMYPGTAKAWHIHKRQTDWWYVMGALKVALYDTRPESPTKGELMELFPGEADYCLVKVPPLVWNGFKGIGVAPAIVANCATLAHRPDEIVRLDPTSDTIPYSWDLRNG